mmetsp:Transcript_408/g.708  ORF Transcript_408/g.708 Transcript_408/m.708 type:complete len:219 (-) Transcript_408:132-788(-)
MAVCHHSQYVGAGVHKVPYVVVGVKAYEVGVQNHFEQFTSVRKHSVELRRGKRSVLKVSYSNAGQMHPQKPRHHHKVVVMHPNNPVFSVAVNSCFREFQVHVSVSLPLTLVFFCVLVASFFNLQSVVVEQLPESSFGVQSQAVLFSVFVKENRHAVSCSKGLTSLLFPGLWNFLVRTSNPDSWNVNANQAQDLGRTPWHFNLVVAFWCFLEAERQSVH